MIGRAIAIACLLLAQACASTYSASSSNDGPSCGTRLECAAAGCSPMPQFCMTGDTCLDVDDNSCECNANCG